MHTMFGAESGDTFYDGNSGNSAVKQEIEDVGVDGNAMVLGSIAQI